MTMQPLGRTAQRQMAFREELPSAAFLRYLDTLQRQVPPVSDERVPWREAALRQAQVAAPGAGVGFAPAVTRAMETRRDVAEALAPLFGVGRPEEMGGTGQSYFDFYGAGLPEVPAVGGVGGRAAIPWHDLTGALAAGAPAGGQTAVQARLQALRQAAVTPESQLTPQQMSLLGAYDTPEARRDVVLTNLMGQTNPMLRRGMADVFNRVYRAQQATAPETPFMQWANTQGFLGPTESMI